MSFHPGNPLRMVYYRLRKKFQHALPLTHNMQSPEKYEEGVDLYRKILYHCARNGISFNDFILDILDKSGTTLYPVPPGVTQRIDNVKSINWDLTGVSRVLSKMEQDAVKKDAHDEVGILLSRAVSLDPTISIYKLSKTVGCSRGKAAKLKEAFDPETYKPHYSERHLIVNFKSELIVYYKPAKEENSHGIHGPNEWLQAADSSGRPDE